MNPTLKRIEQPANFSSISLSGPQTLPTRQKRIGSDHWRSFFLSVGPAAMPSVVEEIAVDDVSFGGATCAAGACAIKGAVLM